MAPQAPQSSVPRGGWKRYLATAPRPEEVGPALVAHDWDRSATPGDQGAVAGHLAGLEPSDFWKVAHHVGAAAAQGKAHPQLVGRVRDQMRMLHRPGTFAVDESRAPLAYRLDLTGLSPEEQADARELLRGMPRVRGVTHGYYLQPGLAEHLPALLGLKVGIKKLGRGEIGDLTPRRPSQVPLAEWQHMTADERADVAAQPQDKLRRAREFFDTLPDTEETAAAAHAGRAKRGWYEDFANVLGLWGKDRKLFAGLLATQSTKHTVQRNLIDALAIWNAWNAAGRPTDLIHHVDQTKRGPLNSVSMAFLNELGSQPGMGTVMFPAQRVAAARLLAGSAQSHELDRDEKPKTSNFQTGLADNSPEAHRAVTNDVWMAMFNAKRHEAGDLQEEFSRAGNTLYHLLSARAAGPVRSLASTPARCRRPSGRWAWRCRAWPLLGCRRRRSCGILPTSTSVRA